MKRDSEWLPMFDGIEDAEVVRGHLPHDRACAVLADNGIDWASIDGTAVEHTYLRCVPTPNGEYDGVYMRTAKGFGAFPATLVTRRRDSVTREEDA